MIKDYYQILGVQRKASDDEIKKSYRKLAFKYHPDRNTHPDAQAMIQDINEAYDVLSDIKKRELYNAKYDYRSVYTGRKVTREDYTPPTQKTYKRRKYRYRKRPIDYTEYAHRGRIISSFVLLFTSILCLDYTVASYYKNSVVEDMKIYIHRSRRSAESYTYEVESTKVNFSANTETGGITKGDTLDIEITPFFGIVKKILRSSNHLPEIRVINVYYPFFFIILAAIVFCIASLTVKSQENSFNFSIFNGVLFLVLLYLSTQL